MPRDFRPFVPLAVLLGVLMMCGSVVILAPDLIVEIRNRVSTFHLRPEPEPDICHDPLMQTIIAHVLGDNFKGSSSLITYPDGSEVEFNRFRIVSPQGREVAESVLGVDGFLVIKRSLADAEFTKRADLIGANFDQWMPDEHEVVGITRQDDLVCTAFGSTQDKVSLLLRRCC